MSGVLILFRKLPGPVCLLLLAPCLHGADDPPDRREVALEPGQFYSVILEPAGAEFSATLFAPDGKQLARDSHRVFTIAESAGSFRLEITKISKNATGGKYTLQIDGPRLATPQDRKRMEAWARFVQARTAERPGTADSRRKAISEYEAALQLWRDAGDIDGEADSLTAIGRIYVLLREPAKAIEAHQKALPLQKSAGNLRGQLDALRGLALAFDSLGDNAQSIECELQGLEVARAIGQKFEEGILLNNLGHAYWALGEERKALDSLDQALRIRKEIKDQLGIAYTLQELGNVRSALGDAQQALDNYRESIPIWRAENNKNGEAFALNNIGLIYSSLGDATKSLDEYGRALAIWRELKSQAGEALTLNNVGLAHSALHQQKQALDEYARALAIFETVGDRRGQAYALQNIGDSHADLGESRPALDYYDRSLALKRALNDRGGEAYTLHNMGDAQAVLGNPAQAAAYYRDALAIRQAIDDRPGEALTRASIARIERDQGNLTAARAQIESALKQIEGLRTSLNSPGLRVAFFASRRSYYDFYIDLLMRMDEPALALQASERARARSLLDTLGELSTDIRQGVNPALLRQELTLARSLKAEAQRLSQLESGPNAPRSIAQSRKRLNDLAAQYEDLQAAIRAASPHYASLTQPEPLDAAEIRRQVLDDDTLLLEFALGQEHSYVWALSSTTLHGFALPADVEIEKLARRVYEALVDRNLRPEGETLAARRDRLNRSEAQYTAAAARLSRMLLAPVTAEIPNKRRLLIVCGGALQYVPFAALPEPGGAAPLMVRHEVVSLPSASALAVLRRELNGRPKPDGTLAVLADPVYEAADPRVQAANTSSNGASPHLQRAESGSGTFSRLRFSREEADQITALATGHKNLEALDFDASPALVHSGRLTGFALVHFATHAVVDTDHPELSGIVLSLVDSRGRSQDGFLRMLEIYNLKLDADLVTLSACRTALGKDIRGEGLVGLTRGFLYAGAARVVSSLWSVEDRATADLMRHFYAGMLKNHLSPSAALRAAQLAMWHDKQWRSPYYWAAFTLQGEWK